MWLLWLLLDLLRTVGALLAVPLRGTALESLALKSLTLGSTLHTLRALILLATLRALILRLRCGTWCRLLLGLLLRLLLLGGCGLWAALSAIATATLATLGTAFAATTIATILCQCRARRYGREQRGDDDLLTHVLRSKRMRAQDRRFILVPI